jgi:valyl-tRNA synthetase
VQKKHEVEDERMQVPFNNVVLHGLVNDPLGKKMSKSKGNVVNPLELVDEYGADAVRFALVYGTALGNDQSLSYPKLDAARKFTNKLWNIARLIEMKKPDNFEFKAGEWLIFEMSKIEKTENDSLIIQKIDILNKEITSYLENYKFNYASERLYDFIWHEFADKYIEDVKTRINNESYIILCFCFLILIKLLHPFMPFVTEEIFHRLYDKKGSLIISEWPK